MGVVYLYYI